MYLSAHPLSLPDLWPPQPGGMDTRQVVEREKLAKKELPCFIITLGLMSGSGIFSVQLPTLA